MQVILQLVFELVKFLKEGSILLSSFPYHQMDSSAQGHGLLVFSIQDTGSGLSQA